MYSMPTVSRKNATNNAQNEIVFIESGSSISFWLFFYSNIKSDLVNHNICHMDFIILFKQDKHSIRIEKRNQLLRCLALDGRTQPFVHPSEHVACRNQNRYVEDESLKSRSHLIPYLAGRASPSLSTRKWANG